MRKGKVGLQKEVSRIFTGIHVPKKNAPDLSAAAQAKVDTGKNPACGEQGQTTYSEPKRAAAPKPVISPMSAVSPAPVISPKPIVAPKSACGEQSRAASSTPVSPAPRPFTIPEPAQPASAAPKAAVYEMPPRQAIYEPPTPSPARQSRPEIPLPKPSWQSALLKIWQPIGDKLLAPKPGVSPVRQKATVALMAILPVILIFVVSKVLLTPAKSGVKPPKASGSAVVASDGKINWELPPVFPENIRDPMVFGAVSTTQSETTGPVVKGIVYSEDNPCAVVGDRIVSVGDVVDGATVVKISPDSVEFAAGGKNWSQKVER